MIWCYGPAKQYPSHLRRKEAVPRYPKLVLTPFFLSLAQEFPFCWLPVRDKLLVQLNLLEPVRDEGFGFEGNGGIGRREK